MISSYRKKRRKVFKLLQQSEEFASMPNDLKSILFGIMILGEQDLDFYEFTPEQVQEIGEICKKTYLSTLSSEEKEALISTMPLEERLKGLTLEERLQLKGLTLEERFIGLKPEERVRGLKPEERLAGIPLEKRLAGIPSEEIKAYFKSLK
jgi:hypothetical protein